MCRYFAHAKCTVNLTFLIVNNTELLWSGKWDPALSHTSRYSSTQPLTVKALVWLPVSHYSIYSGNGQQSTNVRATQKYHLIESDLTTSCLQNPYVANVGPILVNCFLLNRKMSHVDRSWYFIGAQLTGIVEKTLDISYEYYS